MKKFIVILTSALLLTATTAFAQPRAVGVRIGSSISATYQHYLTNPFSFMNAESTFATGDLDISLINPGFSAAATYDFLNPFNTRIPWSYYGDWNWHLGVGLGLGFNSYNRKDPDFSYKYSSNRFHCGIVARLGVEYELEFPMTLGVEWRPTFGPSCNWETVPYKDPKDGKEYRTSSYAGTGFSTAGLCTAGALTLTIKYRF